MTLKLLIDTDVLIKCACYSLLDQFQLPSRDGDEIGIVGVARFVVKSHLERRGKINDRPAAQQRFEDFVSNVSALEPTEEELLLASAIEETGAQLGLDLDVGESQLFAIAFFRMNPLILTGDKRAIIGAERLKDELREIVALQGRIACLEQALIGITERIGIFETRRKVCSEPGVDKSLTICFECHSSELRSDFNADGLKSYVRSLRDQASALLFKSDAM
jgi:hypothetical protein